MPIFLQGQELPLNVTFRGDRLKWFTVLYTNSLYSVLFVELAFYLLYKSMRTDRTEGRATAVQRNHKNMVNDTHKAPHPSPADISQRNPPPCISEAQNALISLLSRNGQTIIAVKPENWLCWSR